MESKIWSRFKWFVNRIIQFKTKSYPLSSYGSKIICLALAGGFVVTISLPDNQPINAIEIVSDPIGLTSIIAMFFGIGLIVFELWSLARKTSIAFIVGLPNQSKEFPEYLLSSYEKRSAREPVLIGSLTDTTPVSIDENIDFYAAERRVDLFNRFILHEKCSKLYIGGLARIPMLVAYGTFLKNISAQIIYFDKSHRNAMWETLNNENEHVSFGEYDLVRTPNVNGDIGIAVGFSTAVSPNHLPKELVGYTTFLKSSTGNCRNLIKNQENLCQLSHCLQQMVDSLNTTDIQRIHFFLSVQSSLAIEIGRQYQEGTHKNWVIHNFDAQQGQYTWAIELSKNGIRRYEIN